MVFEIVHLSDGGWQVVALSRLNYIYDGMQKLSLQKKQQPCYIAGLLFFVI